MRLLLRRRLPLLILAGLMTPALVLLAAYAATPAPPPVPRTVAGDPSLPQVSIRGVKLHVRTFGDPSSPVVIVIHGGPGNDSRYLLPLAALADRYHVVFYDQRGSGLSERVGDDRLTLDAFYAELDGIVDRFGGGQPVRLIGHSWGAMLAAGYLGQHPEKVSQVVLVDPGMLTDETSRLFMEATNHMRPKLSLGLVRAAAGAWLASLHVRDPDPDARGDWLMGTLMQVPGDENPLAGYFCNRDLSTARLEGWRFGARAGPALFRGALDDRGSLLVDFTQGVERFEGKVLFMSGSCNEISGEAHQRRHLRYFRKAELVVIPGAGHTLFGEKPAESIAVVRRYFEEPGGRQEVTN